MGNIVVTWKELGVFTLSDGGVSLLAVLHIGILCISELCELCGSRAIAMADVWLKAWW